MISWTERYMASCTYTKQLKNGSAETRTDKDGGRFIKKWKRHFWRFHRGAVKQPNGPLCNRDMKPDFTFGGFNFTHHFYTVFFE